MGNKKNSVNHYNNHRHALMKRRVPLRDMEQNTVLDETQQHKSLEGSRIVNMHKLQTYISDLNTHNARCEGSIIMPRCTMHRRHTVVRSCVGPSVPRFPVCQISHIFVSDGFKVLKIGQYVIIDILMR